MPDKNPQNRRLGYARVSTVGQTLAVQLEQLRRAGCSQIYREKVSGARPDRRELLKLLKHVQPGTLSDPHA
jgi:DNA invertase Pin-like site-specific DNA recombinase